MHFIQGYHFWGMHLVWWIIWVAIIIWIFATPYEIPGERRRKNSPLDILQKSYAGGLITKEEYEERKAILLNDGVE